MRANLPPVNLPREANPTRVASQYARSLRLASDATRQYHARPNPGTLARRNDRILATLALRAKVGFLSVVASNLRGAARLGSLRRAARVYRARLARWQAYYNGNVAL